MNAGSEAVSEQVQRIRHAILARHGLDAATDVPPSLTERSALEEAAGLMQVSSHWGIASDLPVVGRLLVLVRRTMRLALRWYINPIVDQQNAFNQAVVRSLYELRSENDELRARLKEKSTDLVGRGPDHE